MSQDGPNRPPESLLIPALGAALFASDEPVPPAELAKAFGGIPLEEIENALDRLGQDLERSGSGLRVEPVAGGFQLSTTPDVGPWVRQFFRQRNRARLSPASLETLAIVAYRQPVTSPEIQAIRGKDSSAPLKTLLDKKLLRLLGRKKVVGNPLLYGTSKQFLVHFGLNSLEDLPAIEDFEELVEALAADQPELFAEAEMTDESPAEALAEKPDQTGDGVPGRPLTTMRLNKALADAGLASRRGADRLIADGRVTVNGEIVADLGRQVDPERDAIKLDGKRVPAPPAVHTYLMLNKPRGYVTTVTDPENRPTVMDLIKGISARIYPVGRLDFHTEGLLLLTDDGDLARDLTHPRSAVPKTYLAKVHGLPGFEALGRLRKGIRLDGRPTLPAEVSVKRPARNSWVELVITEGRKHQVRRMLESVGHPVLKLRRVKYDGLSLGSLAAGRFRPLSVNELARLRRAIATKRPSPASRSSRATRRN